MRIAGTVTKDLETEPLGHDKKGNPVYLRDIWPTTEEINDFAEKYVTKKIFKSRYADVFEGDAHWRKVKVPDGETYRWDIGSTYVQNPPYFEGLTKEPEPVDGYRRMRASWRSSATRSPPTTFRRRARSRPPRRPASSSSNIRCRSRTSTSMARAAAIMRS